MLRRIFAALMLVCFAALIGVESFHNHHGEKDDQCQLCAMSAQAVAHTANAAPQVVVTPAAAYRLVFELPGKSAAPIFSSSGRDPPLC